MIIASFKTSALLEDFLAQNGSWEKLDKSNAMHRGQGWRSDAEQLLGIEADVVDRRKSTRLSVGQVSAALADEGQSALADWAPPFRVAWRTEAGPCFAADACGLGNWFSGKAMASRRFQAALQ